MYTLPHKRFDGGFTLIEIVIVLAVSMVLLLVLAQFIGLTSLIGTMISGRLQVDQDFLQVAQVMGTEIRSMTESNLGAYPLVSASTSSLTFYSDIDEDGFFERVRYTMNTSTLEKGVIKPRGNPLSYNFSETTSTAVPYLIRTSSSFTYYGANYTGSEVSLTLPIDPLLVRVVQITLVGDVATTSSPTPTRFSKTIMLRILRSN